MVATLPATEAANAHLNSELARLAATAGERRHPNLNYRGEISPKEAYQFLTRHPGALVDVRTTPEWQFTGVADLSQTMGNMLTVSWKTYPGFLLNQQFVSSLSAQVPDKNTPLLFVCRSGGRSLDAAIAMTDAGYNYCFNVQGGFEGEPDINGHRGKQEGWKADRLPWKQG